jgi:GAF domain-containing protein
MKELPQATSDLAGYELLAAQLEALLSGERDFIANAAQFSAFIFNELPDLNWAGFYLNQHEELVLGPFQGKVACVRIPFARGVCGQAARTRATVRVDDVHAHADHIACDSASNAEIVMPVMHNQRLIGVFDIDSPKLNRFSAEDQVALERLLAIFVAATDFPG